MFIWDVISKLDLALKSSKLDGLVLGDGMGALADGITRLKHIAAYIHSGYVYVYMCVRACMHTYMHAHSTYISYFHECKKIAVD